MLRLIALVLMTLDHLAWLLPNLIPYPVAFVLRLIARLAFPLFAFDCVMGLRRSRNLPSYLTRLAVLAVFSQVSIYLCMKYLRVEDFADFINIFFTLFLGLWVCMLTDLLLASLRGMQVKFALKLPLFTYRNFPLWRKLMRNAVFSTGAKGILLAAAALAGLSVTVVITLLLKPDYALFGLLLLLSLHILNYTQGSFVATATAAEQEKMKYNYMFYLAIINGVYLLIADYILPYFNIDLLYFGDTQLLVIFAPLLFPLACKAKRPHKLLSRALYLYYPLHLAIIATLQYFTMR